MRRSAFVVTLFCVCLCAGQAGSEDFLIWDADGNNNSGDPLKTALQLNGYVGEIHTDTLLTPYLATLDNYCAIFICLGSFPFKYRLKDGEDVDSLVAYLDRGGNIYMEGGDTWFLDEQTDLHPYFKIDAWHNGHYGTDVISGQTFQFTEGMAFEYDGDYIRLDRLNPELGAIAVFQNGPDSVFYNGIAYNAGTYKTVGVSFEFGGLLDGVPPSTKEDLILAMMDQYFRCAPATYDWDVSVLSIDSPDWWICRNTDVVPRVTVKAFGDSVAVDFNITCEILDSTGFSVYSEAVNIAALEKDSTMEVSFPTWTAGEKGNYYEVFAYAQLPEDERPENDTVSITTTTVIPFGTILESNTYTSAGALGDITYCELDGYFYFVSIEKDQVYRVNPEDMSDYSLAFNTGNAGFSAPYGISWDGRYFWIGHMEVCGQMYFFDRQYTYTGTLTGLYVDMTDLAGEWWAGMDYDSKYTRQVTVGASNGIYRLDLYKTSGIWVQDSITGTWSRSANRGCSYIPYTHQILTGATDRDTLFLIDAASGSIDDQTRLQGLLYGVAGVDLYDPGPCNVECAYALVTTSDINSTILKVAVDLNQLVNDFATICVDSPGDSIPLDSTLIVGTVANWGKQDQDSVLVRCEAMHKDSSEAEFRDSTWTSLVPSCEQEQVVFPDKWLPGATGCYKVTVTTSLVGDENYYNNDKRKRVYVTAAPPIHDGTALAINAPPDTIFVDSTYTPKAVVQNLGNVIETFDVECEITPGYVDTQQVELLGSMQLRQVNFTDWTVPGPGGYMMCVRTLVADDINPGNDSLCKDICAVVVAVEEWFEHRLVPKAFDLSLPRPNPFTATTTISYAIADARHIALRVYDLAGRLVSTLVDEVRQPGFYSVTWDGRDSEGVEVPSGTYFYRLTAADFSATRKLVLVR